MSVIQLKILKELNIKNLDYLKIDADQSCNS